MLLIKKFYGSKYLPSVAYQVSLLLDPFLIQSDELLTKIFQDLRLQDLRNVMRANKYINLTVDQLGKYIESV